jgi:flagellar motor switch protein FliG
MPPAPDASNAVPDYARMTKMQKVAALLILLGTESASHILKHFDDQELEGVTTEMAKISFVTQELQQELLQEFGSVAIQAGSSILGGLETTRAALEKSVGMFRASNIIGRVAPSRPTVASIQQIAEMDPRQILNLIKLEQPQTIALLLSYLLPEKGSRVLMLLRSELRDQVVERIATMAPAPIESVERLVETLNRKVGTKCTRALTRTGGVKSAADLLNSLDKSIGKSLLVILEERNPELGAAIRQKMFTFEDLIHLDSASLQKILREVDMRDLAIALKTASEHLKSSLLACISRRAAETIDEEISFMGPLKLREIEAAQTRIIDIVRRLESDCEIDLGDPNSEPIDATLA